MSQISWTKRFTALTLVVSSLVLSQAKASAGEESLSPALKALQGTWIGDSYGTVQTQWTIVDDTVTATVNGVEYGGKLVIDDQAKPHPTLTVELKEGPSEVQGQSAKGVYKLEGEKLIVHVGVPGVDRPKDFTPVDGQSFLFEFTKEKK